MKTLKKVFEDNRDWAETVKAINPDFFKKLADQQSPDYLWIGCSDSRVPANEIVGMLPGEVFVHRNIANLVVHTDLNCLSVIQYAVDVLQVKHVMVVGHYGCGGINAALSGGNHGLIDNWLRHIQDVYRLHQSQIDALDDPIEKSNKLCELNVIEQVANVCDTTIVKNAWARGQELTIHGWVYGICDGILKDLDVCITGLDEVGLTRKSEVTAVELPPEEDY